MDVMEVLGMDAAELEEMLDAVKASNEYSIGAAVVITEKMPHIRHLAEGRGWSGVDIEWLVQSLHAYADYCVTGDTVVTKSSGGNSTPQTMTVKELYDIWHGPRTPARNKYRATSTGVSVMARDALDGRIRPDRVLEVMHKGHRQVFTVTTASGHHITATANHKHWTDQGWKRVDEMQVGDRLGTMGDREHFASPEGTGNPVGVHNDTHLLKQQIRAIGHCEVCGTTEGRLELAHLDHDRSHNTRENLRLLCNHHHKLHDWATGIRKVRHSRGRPLIWSEIVSIEDAGVQEVYDLSMAGDDHSWVGNGVVTSNSFNRAHAASYAVVAYRTAWMRYHYPVEFWRGMLVSYEDAAKIKNRPRKVDVFIAEARRVDRVKVFGPHVNKSRATFTIDRERGGIRKGFRTVKGVGDVAARELETKAPYTSLTDMGQRLLPKRVSGSGALALKKSPLDCGGIIAALDDAGALEGLEHDDGPEHDPGPDPRPRSDAARGTD